MQNIYKAVEALLAQMNARSFNELTLPQLHVAESQVHAYRLKEEQDSFQAGESVATATKALEAANARKTETSDALTAASGSTAQSEAEAAKAAFEAMQAVYARAKADYEKKAQISLETALTDHAKVASAATAAAAAKTAMDDAAKTLETAAKNYKAKAKAAAEADKKLQDAQNADQLAAHTVNRLNAELTVAKRVVREAKEELRFANQIEKQLISLIAGYVEQPEVIIVATSPAPKKKSIFSLIPRVEIVD